MSKCVNKSLNNYFFFLFGFFKSFGLWLPPAKGRSGTPVVATMSCYKKMKNGTACCRVSKLIACLPATLEINFLKCFMQYDWLGRIRRCMNSFIRRKINAQKSRSRNGVG